MKKYTFHVEHEHLELVYIFKLKDDSAEDDLLDPNLAEAAIDEANLFAKTAFVTEFTLPLVPWRKSFSAPKDDAFDAEQVKGLREEGDFIESASYGFTLQLSYIQ